MQKLAEVCIKRPVFATMLILALVVLGLESYRRLGVDFFPKIEFPFVTVTTTLRGASPEEIETQVSKPIEEAVNTVSGIEELRSISSEGVSFVNIQFSLDKDADVAAQDVRDKINGILANLPKDADPPVIAKLSTDASPVISIVVSSPRDPRETTKLVDDVIKKNVETVNGVGQVRWVGDRKRQIQVWLDGNKLYAYNLNVDQVRAALAAQNVEVPGGNIDQGAREMSLRTLGRIEHPRDFARIVVATVNGAPVRIADIGRVEDGFEEPRSLARYNGAPAVVLEVQKQSGTNTLQVIRDVKDRVQQVRGGLPGDFKLTFMRDQSQFIQEAFEAVQAHLIEGGIFAAIIVLIFIRSWRSTLIAAVAIPTSIISTFTLMLAMGFTLNQITMLALVLMVGIVIDDAIVVLENIFRKMEEEHLDPVTAAIEGTREIGLAVLATTLSLVIIFLPVAVMSGIVGRFMSSFGYTAAFAVMVSLLVSFTLTPMMCARYLRVSAHSNTKGGGFFSLLDGGYQAMLRWSMRNRWVVMVVCLLVMYSSIPLFEKLGKDFLPVDDQSEFEILARAPVGSSLEGTAKIFEELEAEARKLPGFKSTLVTIGADAQRKVDRGSVLVNLVGEKERKQTQDQIMVLARERYKRFKDLTISIQRPAQIQGAGPNKNLQYVVQGANLAQLDVYAQKYKALLESMSGVEDIESSYEGGKPELRVLVNRDRAADLGVNVNSIATALRTLVGGDRQVTTYRDGEDRLDVQLRVDKEFRTTPGAMERLYLPSSTLGNVPVANVATFAEAAGPSQIERFNRQRQIMLSANIVPPQSLSNVIAAIDKETAGMNMPPGYSTALMGQSREFGKAGAAFAIAFLLSIAFMYMILAAQFESFIDPFIILMSLPLSVPFAALSLLIARENYQIIYSSVGVLVLFGIVKKNAILQIDHVKNLQRKGIDKLEAIMRGCSDRLRPILMTTAALVAGMIPLALGGGAGSGSRRSVAIIVIGGQTLCLLLTLLVTPVAYSLFEDFAGWFSRLFSGKKRDALQRATPIVLIALLLGGAHPAPAQTRVGVGAAQRKLTLAEAIELALKSNLEIEIERVNRDVAQANLKGAFGAFDPFFRYAPGYENRASATSNALAAPGGKLLESFVNNNFSLGQKFNWHGAQARLDFNNGRLATNNPFTGLSPFLTSQLIASYVQPLWRGWKIDNERAAILVRGKAVQSSDAAFEVRVIDVIVRVQQAYWDLVAVREDEEVKRESVELGRTQVALSKRQIDAGTLAPVEIHAAEAELQRRLDTLYVTRELITQAENNLKTLIAASRESEVWGEEILPTDRRGVEPPEWNDIKGAVDGAVQRRPEMRSVALQLESNAIQQDLAREGLKPQANLTAAYIANGLAGSVNPVPNPFASLGGGGGGNNFGQVPGNLLGGYGQTLNNVFSGNFPTYQVSVAFDFPLRNRAARANVEQTALQARQIKLQQAQVSQAIEAQVRNALQAIETARQRIAATEASAMAAQVKLESETRLFETGESTNFLVLTRQNEYADSRRRAVAAKLDLNKAIARLEQALGTALEAHQIRLR
jgi:HAE1 family hydrophobic/amphiphilic exporter-1